MDIREYIGYEKVWIPAAEMSEEEKDRNPLWEIDGGYLKRTVRSSSNVSPQTWWDSLSGDAKNEVMSLPNFDPEIFRICTGIEVR